MPANTSLIWTVGLLSLGLTLTVGCSESAFEGGGGTSQFAGGAGDNGGKNGGDGPGDDDARGENDDSKGSDSGTGVDDGSGSDEGKESLGEGGDGEEGNLQFDTKDDTLCTSSGVFHIGMIFDNSGSQDDDDLQSMRQGAYSLVRKAAQFRDMENSPTIKLSTVRFSDRAQAGVNGWVALDDAQGDVRIKQDIDASTADDGGNTFYSRALTAMNRLYGQLDTGKDKKEHRNFILFFTDGAPEDEDKIPAINAARDLANDLGVAVLAVATGSDDEGWQTLNQISVPKIGVVDDDHVGQAFRARTQQEVVQKFGELFEKVTDACK